jgi:hypothetical protein
VLPHGADAAARLWLTPVLLARLGTEAFGLWLVMSQYMGYVAITDLRPSGTLRLTLSARQHTIDDSARRRLIGAALHLSLVSLPLVVMAAAVAVAVFPWLVTTRSVTPASARLALGVLLLGMTIE